MPDDDDGYAILSYEELAVAPAYPGEALQVWIVVFEERETGQRHGLYWDGEKLEWRGSLEIAGQLYREYRAGLERMPDQVAHAHIVPDPNHPHDVTEVRLMQNG